MFSRVQIGKAHHIILHAEYFATEYFQLEILFGIALAYFSGPFFNCIFYVLGLEINSM